MSRPEDADGFLSRWSRRKQAIQQGVAAPEPVVPAEAPAPEAKTGAAPVELPLPSLDDVLPGGDVSAFLQKHVPDSLRNAALRKAWESDPVISGFIEMADYQLNYANPDSIPGWSSSIEGVDVKKFVDALFKGAPEKEEPDAEELENQAQIAQKEGDEFIITNSEPAEIVEISDENAALHAVHPLETDDVISTNNTDNSGGYVPQKKRHGGALPS